MKRTIILLVALTSSFALSAQSIYSLQRCRQLALDNNRQLKISRLTADVAADVHQAAKTKYLPRIDGLAGYEHFSREISLLSNRQKSALSNIGTNTIGQLGTNIGEGINGLVQQGLITPAAAQQLTQLVGSIASPLAQTGNNIGQAIRDAFRTNTKNMYAGSILLTQPVYMGGAIKAANDMATIGEEMAANDIELKRQNVLFAVDNAYWIAVSLKKKQQLAQQYRDLMQKFDDDVHKMIREGIATRADGLKVDVGLNTADLHITQIENGISLAKMALCQLCGIALDGNIRLADEDVNDLTPVYSLPQELQDTTFNARPEVRLFQNAIDLSRQNTRLVRALYRPHVALTGGYTVSNPNLFNGFQEKFSGIWNIGVVVQVPIWNWNEGKYKIRASRTATSIARLELDDLRNKVQLDIEQNRFRLKNANKQLATADRNMAAANENLRCANVGFKEGVMTVTDVMTAQTAWQAARTAIIDAEIAVRMAEAGVRKAMGEL